MAHGLQVYNSSGILQIDSLYKNISLVSSGSVVCSGNSTGSSRSAIINVTGQNPILALRQPDHGVTAIAYAKSGNVFSFEILAHLYRRSDNAVMTNITVEYFVFDVTPNTTPSGYGLQVNNESGQAIYSSNNRYFKMLNPKLAVSSYFDIIPITFSGKTVLPAICDFGYNVTSTFLPTNPDFYQVHTRVMYARTISSNTLEAFVGQPSIGVYPSPLNTNKVATFAAIDVTGYGI